MSKNPEDPRNPKIQEELDELFAINQRIYEEYPEFDPERIEEYPNDEKIRALKFISVDELLPFWNWDADKNAKVMRRNESESAGQDEDTSKDKGEDERKGENIKPPFKKFVIFQISNNRIIHPEKIASAIATRENIISSHISPAARLQITEKIAKIAAKEDVGEISNSQTFGRGYDKGNYIVACAILNDELYAIEKEKAQRELQWRVSTDGTPFKKDNSEIIIKKSRFAYLDGMAQGLTIFNCELSNRDYTIEYRNYWSRAITSDRTTYRINRMPRKYTDFPIIKANAPDIGNKNVRVRYLGAHKYASDKIGTLVAYEICDTGFHNTTIKDLRNFFGWESSPAGSEYHDDEPKTEIFNAAKEVAEMYAGTPLIVIRKYYGTNFIALGKYDRRLAVFNVRYTNMKNNYYGDIPDSERTLGIENAHGEFIAFEPGNDILGIETSSNVSDDPRIDLKSKGYCELAHTHINARIPENPDATFTIYAINHKNTRVELEKALRKIDVCDSYNLLIDDKMVVEIDKSLREFIKTYYANYICFVTVSDKRREYIFGIKENYVRLYNAHHLEDFADREWNIDHNWVCSITTTGDQNKITIKLKTGEVVDYSGGR